MEYLEEAQGQLQAQEAASPKTADIGSSVGNAAR